MGGVSSKGSCTEAPEGATAQVPDEQRTDETPLIGGEHLQSTSHTQENLEGLTESRHSWTPSQEEESLWCSQKEG